MIMTKVCGHCRKAGNDFFKNSATPSGLSSWCKPCVSARSKRDYPIRIKAQTRSRLLMKLYGLTLAAYNQKLIEQDHRCAICRKHQIESDRAFAVDHNHKTGQIRSLLCPACNWKVGFLETVNLQPFQEYLKSFTEVTI